MPSLDLSKFKPEERAKKLHEFFEDCIRQGIESAMWQISVPTEISLDRTYDNLKILNGYGEISNNEMGEFDALYRQSKQSLRAYEEKKDEIFRRVKNKLRGNRKTG